MQRPAPERTRREPPPFRRVEVARSHAVTPHLRRVTFTGRDLGGLEIPLPASSVRVLLPPAGTHELVLPQWNGNEFLLAGGQRPTIRTLTPRRLDPVALELDVEIVLHEAGRASEWARAARPGDPAAISGPGRGYTIDTDAPAFLLFGDETALPAITEVLVVLPRDRPVQVHLEVAHPDARLALPDHPRADVAWHDRMPGAPPGNALVAAVQDADLVPGTRVWAAGEAAAMQRIRRHLFDTRAVPRTQASIRGYWKHGRAGDEGVDD